MYMHVNIFKIYTVCVCIYIYINTHIHIVCKQKKIFWMRLIAINHLTALIININYRILKTNKHSYRWSRNTVEDIVESGVKLWFTTELICRKAGT